MAAARVAVITPYYDEPIAMLEQAHRSVLAQGVSADHFLIADGKPLDAIDRWSARHIKLDRAHGDNGNTPRGIGSLLARNEGYDFIAYLDSDNWFHDNHLRSLLETRSKTGNPVCASLRTFHGMDGTDLRIAEDDEDSLRHIDTSCYLIHRTGFACLPAWLDMPKPLSPIGDRIFLAALRHRQWPIASTGLRTVAFRSRYRSHYEAAGVPVPTDAKDRRELQPSFDYLATAEGVSASVAALGFWPLPYLNG